MATRNFHNRVKAFLNKIVLDKTNPMNVKYYTYKVEFQQRGAAHIHGTLWLDLPKIEKLKEVNGELQNSEEMGPMAGLEVAFQKLKKSSKIDEWTLNTPCVHEMRIRNCFW